MGRMETAVNQICVLPDFRIVTLLFRKHGNFVGRIDDFWETVVYGLGVTNLCGFSGYNATKPALRHYLCFGIMP